MEKPQLTDSAGWRGDKRRGAELGRDNAGEPGPAPVKFYLSRIRLNSGGYDTCGAYWGLGAPLYWASSEDNQTERWLRADDRDDARAQIVAEFPNARFFR